MKLILVALMVVGLLLAGCSSDTDVRPSGRVATTEGRTLPPTIDVALTWSDVWLLFAVIWAARDGDASLSSVIGAGDAINHAIFSFEEVDQGSARLVAADLITYSDGRYRVTESGQELFTVAREDGLWETLIALGTAIGLSEPVRFDPNPDPSRWSSGLSPVAFDQAIAEYRRWFDEQS